MMIEESDIHRNVSLLADTACHEHVKFLYCHMVIVLCLLNFFVDLHGFVQYTFLTRRP